MLQSLNQRVERMVSGSRALYGLEAGSCLWVPCDKNVWRAGIVSGTREEESSGVRKTVAVVETLGDRGREKVIIDINGSGPTGGPAYYLRTGDALNVQAAQAVEDLSLLPMLHEPEILQSVKMRYTGLNIYTFAGPMLLAVNPYQQILGLYDNATLQTFINAPYGCPAPAPHIFGTARDAFMGIQHSDLSQTVLVSGESGAGKTESAKFVIRFLALAGGRKAPESEVTMEHRVLESVPLLEALGNARTLKNDNSSRFGKFIELHFQNIPGVFGPCIMNAETHTYLLETVRVTELSEGERVFHIFYQILAAAAAARSKQVLQPGQKLPSLIPSIPSLVFPDINEWSCKKFKYLSRSTFEKLPGVDEAVLFHRNIEAMRAFYMSDEEISQVISAIVACLHLGNIEFQDVPGNSEASEVVNADYLDGPLCKAADLLGVDSENLEMALCSRVLQLYEKSTKQIIRKSRTKAQAADCRDGLARHLYMMVFAHVLGRINQSLSAGAGSDDYYARKASLPSIGVLDIFGFEVFEQNCFEQLCINYANEVLQQHFNLVAFEHELALYADEGIPCNLQDMQAATKLQTSIRESNVLPGVFPMLDDECTISGGTSDNWLSKVAKAYGNSAAFELVPLKKGYFKLQHFAGPVEYCADAFIPKNKDTLSAEAMECMQGSSKKVLQQTFAGHGRTFGTTTSMTGRVLKAKANSVSSDFREQLDKLMKNIQATRPHFVRCVKPNQMMAPNMFNSFSVLQQLKYQGVLEAIRVARAGFATRFQHAQAVLMYWNLAPSLRKQLQQLMRRSMHHEASQLLFAHLRDSIAGLSHGGIQVGKTLTFFKSDATEVLGIHVQKYREAAALQIQAWWRMRRLNRFFNAVRKAVVMIQRVELGRKARTGFRFLRSAAITIQASWRSYEIRLIFKQVVKAVICIQRFLRPRLVATKNRTRMLYANYGKQASQPTVVQGAVTQRPVVQERALAVAKPKRFVAPDKFARYLKTPDTTAIVPRRKTTPEPVREEQLVSVSEVDKVKEELGSQIRQQQEAIEKLYSMMQAQQSGQEAANSVAIETQTVQNAVLKDYVSAQLHAMNERVAGLGSTLVAMDAAVSAEKERAEAQQVALREQHAAFQASISQQFQVMKNEVSTLVRGAETDTARVTGSLMEFESFVTSRFNTLEQSFEKAQGSVGQEKLEQAIEGLRGELHEKHRAIEESVSVINPRLGDITNQFEELSGLEAHVRELMERHQAMSEQQQNLLAAPEALKTQIGSELEEQQAALRKEMASSMEQTLAVLRQDLEKTTGFVTSQSQYTEAQQQQANSLIAEQRKDMATSMEAALSTLKEYMDTADGVGTSIGRRHEEMEEKNAQHIGLLRGEMAKAMGAMLVDLQRSASARALQPHRVLPTGAPGQVTGRAVAYAPVTGRAVSPQPAMPGLVQGPARNPNAARMYSTMNGQQGPLLNATQGPVAPGATMVYPNQAAVYPSQPGGSLTTPAAAAASAAAVAPPSALGAPIRNQASGLLQGVPGSLQLAQRGRLEQSPPSMQRGRLEQSPPPPARAVRLAQSPPPPERRVPGAGMPLRQLQLSPSAQRPSAPSAPAMSPNAQSPPSTSGGGSLLLQSPTPSSQPSSAQPQFYQPRRQTLPGMRPAPAEGQVFNWSPQSADLSGSGSRTFHSGGGSCRVPGGNAQAYSGRSNLSPNESNVGSQPGFSRHDQEW